MNIVSLTALSAVILSKSIAEAGLTDKTNNNPKNKTIILKFNYFLPPF